MKRQEANLAILAMLTGYVMRSPQQRFGQILRNTGLIIDFVNKDGGDGGAQWMNHFMEESTSILKRMEEEEKKMGMS